MLIVLAEAKLGEGALEEGREALTTMIEASQTEEGCDSYAYSQCIQDPSILRITEKWVDNDALIAHFQTPHMAEFQQALSGLDVQVTEVLKYEADDGAPVM